MHPSALPSYLLRQIRDRLFHAVCVWGLCIVVHYVIVFPLLTAAAWHHSHGISLAVITLVVALDFLLGGPLTGTRADAAAPKGGA